MSACPALRTDDGASLSGALQSLDCQVNGAVASGYGHLFGPHGVLGPALTAMLTLYVAILALALITGRTRLTLGTLGPKMLTVGVILAFATAWPAYHVVVYGLLTGGPDQVASALLGAQAGATQAFAARLDQLFNAVLEVGQALSAAPRSPKTEMAANLVWASAFLILLTTLGVLVIARIILAALLALGPVFIVLGLFSGTRGLFEGWLRLAAAFALTPLLTVVGGSGLLSALGPVTDAIAQDPLGAADQMRPVATLFAVAVIYAGLLLTLAAAASALTREWRIGRDDAAPAADPALTLQVEREAAQRLAAAGQDGRAAGDRVAAIAAAVTRDDAAPAERRNAISVPAAVAPEPSRRAPARDRRAAGLGQTFRPTSAGRPLSGTVGS